MNKITSALITRTRTRTHNLLTR